MKLNIVPARTGLTWVRQGIRTFLRQPLALAGLFFMYVSVVILLSVLPVVGLLIGGVLVPAATLGLMVATAQASEGKFPMPTVLVSAFRAGRQRARAMLALGLMYTAGSMLATLLAGLIAGGPAPAPAAGEAPLPDAAMLLSLLFHTPLFLLFWHAPALVHWHGVSPVKSLFFSAVACLRNFGAMTLYSLAWGGVFMLGALVFGSVGMMLGGEGSMRAVMLPLALILAAMFSTSVYFTFRDSFVFDDAPGVAPGA